MLYNKKLEKDNCGYGLICNKNGTPSRKIVEKSIDALSSMAHRGGVGFDGKTGDGSGLLFDINDDFYRKTIKSEHSLELPKEFGIGFFFAKKSLKGQLQSDLKKIFKSIYLKRSTVVNFEILLFYSFFMKKIRKFQNSWKMKHCNISF